MKYVRFSGALILLLLVLLAACQPAPASPTTQSLANTPTAQAVSSSDEGSASSTNVPVTQPASTPASDEDPLASIVNAFSGQPQSAGNVLVLYGQVLDANGSPLEGATVEIWQTDYQGIYDHPNDPRTSSRDPNFQSYGSVTTDANGLYSFRTIIPAAYENRPPHIHVKVKVGGTTLLTTQFYFVDVQSQNASDAIFSQLGAAAENVLLTPTDFTDAAGNAVLVAQKDIVVAAGQGAGSLTLTPSQTEGPYYPVVPVENYDNDLTIKN
jgi:protocatechuate 3,4-dioxygenase beta subunit